MVIGVTGEEVGASPSAMLLSGEYFLGRPLFFLPEDSMLNPDDGGTSCDPSPYCKFIDSIGFDPGIRLELLKGNLGFCNMGEELLVLVVVLEKLGVLYELGGSPTIMPGGGCGWVWCCCGCCGGGSLKSIGNAMGILENGSWFWDWFLERERERD